MYLCFQLTITVSESYIHSIRQIALLKESRPELTLDNIQWTKRDIKSVFLIFKSCVNNTLGAASAVMNLSVPWSHGVNQPSGQQATEAGNHQ